MASVLPYLDAIFIETEVAGLLSEEPLRTRIDFGTKIFSANRRDQFLAYLQELRDRASDEHVELVHEVYGDGYLRPFTGVFRENEAGGG
jgi:hypothetical protein